MKFSIRLPPPIAFSDESNIAPLAHVSLEQLRAGDDHESAKVFEACKKAGFFVLNLQNDSLGEGLMDDADALMDLSEELFALELEEKQKFAMRKGTFSGYKAVGTLKVDAKGTPDRCEFFGVLKDELLEISPVLNQPDIIMRHRELYSSFTRRAHELAMMILASLGKSLELPPGTLESLHRISAPSDNQTRLIRYPPQPAADRRTSFVAHTDFGSVTVLFNVLGGLQILPDTSSNDWTSIPEPDESTWQFVRPVPGCAIINLGDAMVKFTNGVLRSNLHRVVSAPGEQGNLVRNSVACFLRPERDVLLKRLDYGSTVIPPLEEGVVEESITSSAWIDTKGTSKKIVSGAK